MSQDQISNLDATRGECTRELDGALDGDQLFEVLVYGGLHLVITGVVPVSGNADKKAEFISIKMTSR